MNEEQIARLLNDSDLDFSGDDDDDEYLPPEDLQGLQESEESEEVEEEGMSGQGFDDTDQVSHSTSRLFWRTQEMSHRGPDIVDDQLIAQGTSEINTLYAFFEYLGQDFWDLVTEQTNLYSAQKRDL
jgi:hypothetical protein